MKIKYNSTLAEIRAWMRENNLHKQYSINRFNRRLIAGWFYAVTERGPEPRYRLGIGCKPFEAAASAWPRLITRKS